MGDRTCHPLNMGDVPRAPVFDMRNGPVEAAVSIYVRPTIPEAFRWVPIANLPPNRALEYANVFVRSAYAQIHANPPAGMPDEVQRKVAIVLGTSRAVMTAYYHLQEADLIPGETVAPVFEYATDQNGLPFIQATAAAAQPIVDSANAMANMTPEDAAAATVLLTSSVGALPLAGYSLIMTGHHYLSERNTQSRRAYDVVERQFWRSASVQPWFNAQADLLRDMAWHKAAHPVNIALKHQLAKDPKIARMLVCAGVGSAAARLPALESELRAANSYKTLCSTVRPLFESYSGELDFSLLTDAIELVQLFPVGAPPMPVPQGVVIPPGVNDRPSALGFLQRLMDGNSDIVAFCYGFYIALADNNAVVGGTAQQDTLRASYSLSKLKNQSFAAYTAGMEAFKDYTSAKTMARQAGRYTPPKFSFR